MWESILSRLNFAEDGAYRRYIIDALAEQGFKFDGKHIVPIAVDENFFVGDIVRRIGGDGLEWKVVRFINNDIALIECADREMEVCLRDGRWERVGNPCLKIEKGKWYVCIKSDELCCFHVGELLYAKEDWHLSREGYDWQSIPSMVVSEYFRYATEEEIKGNNGGISHNFKVGDWIVDSTDRRREPMQIKKILGVGYTTEQGSFIDFKEENNFHLWSIEDSKDGDVLVYSENQWIFLFKNIIDKHNIRYHALYDTEFRELYIDESANSVLENRIVPATKEQRDLLFAKMKEAGYEWDAEHKQLLKLSNVERTGKNCEELTEFEKELIEIIGDSISQSAITPDMSIIEFAKQYSDKLLSIARKQIASETDVDAMVNEYIKHLNSKGVNTFDGFAASVYRQGIERCKLAIQKGE